MDAWVLAIFAIVYLGMILGGLPRLHLDRTGVALLGAIAVVGLGVMTPEAAAQSIHLPTILLLFSFMVVSAQLRLGGFYGWVTTAVSGLNLGPAALLGVVILVVALLSAVFSNDIVCLAMAPMLADACARKRLNPVPFLLALACAANIGSALTLIGNPQNMLIGETLKLPFGAYLLEALVPVTLSLLALWAWLARGLSRPYTPVAMMAAGDDFIALDRWQSAKGVAVAAALLAVFLFTDWPRDVAALVGAGLLLLSQRFHSSKVMREIDWELLVLFMGLFVVNHALELTGLSARGVAALAQSGVDLSQPAPLFASTLLLSNLVSNVPAVMLLLPLAREPWAGPLLALVSTLAGNLLLVGSIANLIVVDAARRQGIAIDWRLHARVGVPVALLSLVVTAGWFAVRG
ncbi:SLC13 family permease [Roseateles toxinivorans]|uniref:YbiR family transporter n=1 Tax=Roseateles toxinivorans TaxID=270368 RepID=A0A4R6QKP6_9BURK|nr:SLC13 family permease [Roseateles toxinivorans]TDP63953.1 YbiR family transporter [Roseateles toxinivorans]